MPFVFLEPGKKLKNAYCSAAATGQYELRINGKLPDDSVLNGSGRIFTNGSITGRSRSPLF